MNVLLTSVAALFLATGTAHARSYEAYHCGKLDIELVFEKYFSINRTDCTGGPCDGKEHYFIVKPAKLYLKGRVDSAVHVRNGVTFYRGRKCREFTQEEYNK
jgi:hypothetical protein